jgi:4-hydroxy-tetrahydrodipicolinate reductase
MMAVLTNNLEGLNLADNKPISVVIAGARGKMGREALRALEMDKRFRVAGVLVRNLHVDVGDTYPAFDDPQTLLSTIQPDVWLDLTDANSVVHHVDLALSHGVRPVVGATGYSDDDLARWTAVCEENQIGAVVAPNFAIGALLMIRFAEEASKFFQNVEIIELHHDGKRDAPSGTAKRTAKAIAEARKGSNADAQAETRELLSKSDADAARGQAVHGVHVHSVRLPGLVAHQEVIFGGTGEVLTIRHDSLSRASFMPGVLTACERVMNLRSLVYGLEHLLF